MSDEVWICLDCAEHKTIYEMATVVPDMTAEETGGPVGSCKECQS